MQSKRIVFAAKKKLRSLSGRAANEVYAMMAMAGVESEGAAGSRRVAPI